MRSQQSLWVQILVGGIFALVGTFFCVASFLQPSEEPEVTARRTLRSRPASPPEEKPDPLIMTALGFLIAAAGAGVALDGWNRRAFQEDLLKRGTPVEGQITRVVEKHGDGELSEASYCFEDHQGELREGVYRYNFSFLSDTAFTEGQAVTVIYDPDDSRKHVLDLENKRRARTQRRG